MRILREKEVCNRLGIGRTQLRTKYIATGRLSWIALGVRCKGLLESEVDGLIAELARNRDPLPRPVMTKTKKETTRRKKAA